MVMPDARGAWSGPQRFRVFHQRDGSALVELVCPCAQPFVTVPDGDDFVHALARLVLMHDEMAPSCPHADPLGEVKEVRPGESVETWFFGARS